MSWCELSKIPGFKCNKCLQMPERNHICKIKLGNVEYETVDQFCHFSGMLINSGGEDGNKQALSPR